MDLSGREVVEPSEPSEEESLADLARHYDIVLVRAPNPGPLTLTGTNTWLVGRRPTWVVDPGPLLQEHMQALFEAIQQRGGLGGVVLTHDHHDHSEAARTLVERYGVPLAAGRGAVDVALGEGLGWGRSPPSRRPGTPPTTTP